MKDRSWKEKYQKVLLNEQIKYTKGTYDRQGLERNISKGIIQLTN
jgi:hypothetical protein